jgi:hypothetical protein
MEAKTLFFYLIVAIAITALIIAIVALVNANTANDNANTANNSLVNYTALSGEYTELVKNTAITENVSTLNYVVNIPLDKWKYDGFNVGILGSINVPIAQAIKAGAISWAIEYSKNSGESQLTEAGNQTVVNVGSTSVNVNLNTAIPETFKKGDTLVLNIYSIGVEASYEIDSAIAATAAIVFGPLNVQ